MIRSVKRADLIMHADRSRDATRLVSKLLLTPLPSSYDHSTYCGEASVDTFSSSRAKLGDLTHEYASPTFMNEATTRLQVIDRLLMDCLGWAPTEIAAETHYAGEFVDYAIGAPAIEMIVEAKKEGIPFTLPAGISGRRVVDLPTALTDGATKAAIEQVTRYCQDRGVPIGVICNGHQLLAFYASRQDGVPPMMGRSLCFSSLDEMLADFTVFWNYLSRDGIAARNLQRVLFGRTFKALAPGKLSDRIANYPGFRARTRLETDLKILGGLFIQDLENEPEISDDFLKRCYVQSGALSQYSLVSREILQARYNSLPKITDVEIEPARTKRGPSKYLSSDAMAAAMTRRPLILIGDVGVGKSMFLRHFIRIDAGEVLDKSLVFYIDFGKEPALATNLESHVAQKITQQLRGEYNVDVNEQRFVRAVYNKEVNDFKRGIYASLEKDNLNEFKRQEIEMLKQLVSDRPEHLRRSLEHIRATQRRASVVVLDNVDQRPSDFQERVFLIAQSLADTWPATVFVSLRPSTFFESRTRGSLAAYQLRVFTVTPTRCDDVISRRLSFARRQLDAVEESGSFPMNLSLSGKDMQAYLDVLLKAFSQDQQLKTLIENLSGGNLRLALTFLSSFVGSGYVSTQRILDAAEAGDTYNVPIHEFLRSIIYGDYDYYDPTASEICNLFDITSDDGREHFLLTLMLAHVQRLGESAGGDGYVDVSEIYSLSQSLGFLQEQVGPHIERALAKRLLEAPQGRGAGGPLRITTVGSYMYKSMIHQFSYVDAMIVDTPIIEVRFRTQVGDVKSISDRLDRTVTFRNYLDEQWHRLQIADGQHAFNWLESSAQLAKDIGNARFRADRRARLDRD